MKRQVLPIILTLILIPLINQLSAQIGINEDGSSPDPSAMFDVKSTDRGFLPPRMTHVQMNAISNPANGLMVYCIDCGSNGLGAIAIFTTGIWYISNFNCLSPSSPIPGTYVPQQTQIVWNWSTINDATGYKWNTINDYNTAIDLGNITTMTETGLTACVTTLTHYVWAYNFCGTSQPTELIRSTLSIPDSPIPATPSVTSNQIIWKWHPPLDPSNYKWNNEDNYSTAIEIGTDTVKIETDLYCNTSYTRYLWAYNSCGVSPTAVLTQSTSVDPVTPSEGIQLASKHQIVWNWNASSDASGYKWNTTDNYNTAIDMGSLTSKTETGLICETGYIRYVWAYNDCGVSDSTTLTGSTTSCWVCGDPFTVNHVVGDVAPVNKTTTYGTVNNIPGEESKCWITSNLGADHQADSVNDPTEPSAGWLWQFNRKQGYMCDTTARTPNTYWIAPILEDSDWVPVNDPCTLELGNGWRIPTQNEWTNIKNAGEWTDWNGPWGSALKLHAAGFLDDGPGGGYLNDFRGWVGAYHSSSQTPFEWAYVYSLTFEQGYCRVYWDNPKPAGYSIRCIKD